jgi:CTP synthase (UTP-ammonia lyase)
MIHTMRIGLIGDFHPTYQAHQAIPRAIELATADLRCCAELTWLPTVQVEQAGEAALADCDGLWCVPGSPYESMAGALRGKPFVGT